MECSEDKDENIVNVKVEIKEELQDVNDGNYNGNNGYLDNFEDIKLPFTIFLQPQVEPLEQEEEVRQVEEMENNDDEVIVKHEEVLPFSDDNNSCSEEEEVAKCSVANTISEKLRYFSRDALRRQAKCVKTGAATSTSKTRKFQAEVEFRQPDMANRKRNNNLNDESSEYEQLDREDTQEPNSVCKPTSEESENGGGASKTTSIFPGSLKEKPFRRQTQESPSELPGASLENSPTPQKQVEKKDDLTILLKQYIESRGKRAAERVAERAVLLDRIQPPNDSLYHFFMSLYKTTKNMPLSLQHVVKNHIYKTVMDMEANLLKIPPTYCVQQTSQFNQRNVQHQFSPSTSDSSYSENLSHQNFTSNMHDAS